MIFKFDSANKFTTIVFCKKKIQHQLVIEFE